MVFIEPEDFVIPSVPHLHFEGPGNARAKERVLSRLLTCIMTVVETRKFRQTENIAVGEDFPISPLPPRNPKERQKRPSEPSLDSLTNSLPRVRPATPRNSSTTLRASEVPWVAPWPRSPSQPILPPHSSLEEQ